MVYLSLSLIVHPFLEKKLGTQIWLTRNKNPEKENVCALTVHVWISQRLLDFGHF